MSMEPQRDFVCIQKVVLFVPSKAGVAHPPGVMDSSTVKASSKIQPDDPTWNGQLDFYFYVRFAQILQVMAMTAILEVGFVFLTFWPVCNCLFD